MSLLEDMRRALQKPLEDSRYHGAYLLASGKFSDFTFRCAGQEIKVHRAMICKADHFKKLCTSSFTEVTQGFVQFVDEDLPTIASLLLFLYVSDCDWVRARRELPSLEPWLKKMGLPDLKTYNRHIYHIKAHLVADKYLFEGMKKHAWENIQRSLQDIDDHRQWEDAIQLIYEEASTDRLRALAVWSVHRELIHPQIEKKCVKVIKMMETTPEFGRDMVRKRPRAYLAWCSSSQCRKRPDLQGPLEDYGCCCGWKDNCGRRCQRENLEDLACTRCLAIGTLTVKLDEDRYVTGFTTPDYEGEEDDYDEY